MTLDLCYELRLSGTMGDEDAVARLDALRMHAQSLDVAEVTPLWRVSRTEFSVDLDAWEHRPLPRRGHLKVRNVPDARQQPLERDRRLDVAGFFMRPEPTSRCAVFGLVRPGPSEFATDRDGSEQQDWFWEYRVAPPGSDAVMRMLSRARELGFEVSVRDGI